MNAQIKYSNSDEEVFSPKYFEKATAVDVSLNLEDSKLIEKIEEKITEDFKSVIMEIYRNIGEKRERTPYCQIQTEIEEKGENY